MACLEGACTGQAHLSPACSRPLPELPGGQGRGADLWPVFHGGQPLPPGQLFLALENFWVSLRLSWVHAASLRCSPTGHSSPGQEAALSGHVVRAAPWSAGLRAALRRVGTGWVRCLCSRREPPGRGVGRALVVRGAEAGGGQGARGGGSNPRTRRTWTGGREAGGHSWKPGQARPLLLVWSRWQPRHRAAGTQPGLRRSASPMDMGGRAPGPSCPCPRGLGARSWGLGRGLPGLGPESLSPACSALQFGFGEVTLMVQLDQDPRPARRRALLTSAFLGPEQFVGTPRGQAQPRRRREELARRLKESARGAVAEHGWSHAVHGEQALAGAQLLWRCR